MPISSEKFPYEKFPIRLDVNSKKVTASVCFFSDVFYAEKYISRHKLTKREYKLSQPRKKRKKKEE
jgi:hypothetical protein